MPQISDVPDLPSTGVKIRTPPLLVMAPAGAILLVAVLYFLLSSSMPSQVARHVGPDGVGFGSTLLMLSITCGVAAIAFVIAGCTAREFLKDDHWYQTEKSIVVGFLSLGYGVVGIAVATILSTVGIEPGEASGDSVGVGMLGFLLTFIVAVYVHVKALPRAKMEVMG